MPRSAYLFGDEPDEPGYAEVADGDRKRTPRKAAKAAGRRRARQTRAGDGRHRSPGRLPRSWVLTGSAAAATLVVSLGVGAVLLPDTEDRHNSAATADAPEVAPPLPAIAMSPSGSAQPSVSSSPAPTASPSPSLRPRAVTASPQRVRPTAPSRRSVVRTPTPATSPTAPLTGATGDDEQDEVVSLVNAERARAGCDAVTVDDKLTVAAQRHSEDQATHRTMSHEGSDGSDAGERLARVGYAWRTYGENVAWNQPTPTEVMAAWMDSPGHRANILNCAFTEIGVGVARSNGPYWTQVFGTPS